jgi:Zn-dependent protease
MKWAWRIGTFSGIGVYVHATFLLLIAWILGTHVLAGQGAGVAVQGLGFIVLLFACVVAHELGHAVVAQRFGVQTRDITLYPIGGIARLQRIPREPRQELLIALAGPLVNLVIAAALGAGLLTAGLLTGLGAVRWIGGNLLSVLMWVNVGLALFNLLPAFPMDGGRVLRAFLALHGDYAEATRRAAAIGQLMAFVFGFVGLMASPLLLFIAFFVYLGATEEAAIVQAELAFQGVPVRQAMMTRFARVGQDEPLSRAVEQLLAGPQPDFPVVDAEGETVGLLTRSGLVAALAEQGPAVRIGEVMAAVPKPATPEDSLEALFQQMRDTGTTTVPVRDQD